MPKDFALSWILEPLEDLDTYLTKRMFGGLAAYLDGKMIALLAESPGDREWKGQTFDFEIWDGLLIPTSREHHESLQKEFPYLLNHPVLGKWLYLPQKDESFEGSAEELIARILVKDERFGIVPKPKKKKTKTSKKKTVKKAKKKLKKLKKKKTSLKLSKKTRKK